MSALGRSRNKWGDDDEDELPEMHETPLNAQGVKTRTEYKMNGPARVKVTSKVRVITETRTTNKAAQARRERMTKFGNALGVDHDNVTIVDEKNEVYMLDPAASEAEDQGQAANINKAFESFQKKNQMRALERKYQLDMEAGEAGEEGEPGDKPKKGGLFAGATGGKGLEKEMASGGGLGGMMGGAGAGGKYVPPSARGGAGGGMGGGLSMMAMDDKDRQPTLRVSNISEDTKEADLQELFEPFGSIYRIYLAKDKDTMQSRGFAFVSFNHRGDAEQAMKRLQGYGYDHLILKLEWAKPSAKEGGAGGAGGGGGGGGEQFRSGYGKALAQDTTEKVSYASNLTSGTGAVGTGMGGKF